MCCAAAACRSPPACAFPSLRTCSHSSLPNTPLAPPHVTHLPPGSPAPGSRPPLADLRKRGGKGERHILYPVTRRRRQAGDARGACPIPAPPSRQLTPSQLASAPLPATGSRRRARQTRRAPFPQAAAGGGRRHTRPVSAGGSTRQQSAAGCEPGTPRAPTQFLQAEAHEVDLQVALGRAQAPHDDAPAGGDLLVPRVHQVGQRLEGVGGVEACGGGGRCI
jgi:hypothetical protein